MDGIRFLDFFENCGYHHIRENINRNVRETLGTTQTWIPTVLGANVLFRIPQQGLMWVCVCVCVCVCVRSGSATLQQLPAHWLKEVLVEVKSSDPSSKLCATRRSAGIPFYIQVSTLGLRYVQHRQLDLSSSQINHLHLKKQ